MYNKSSSCLGIKQQAGSIQQTVLERGGVVVLASRILGEFVTVSSFPECLFLEDASVSP